MCWKQYGNYFCVKWWNFRDCNWYSFKRIWLPFNYKAIYNMYSLNLENISWNVGNICTYDIYNEKKQKGKLGEAEKCLKKKSFQVSSQSNLCIYFFYCGCNSFWFDCVDFFTYIKNTFDSTLSVDATTRVVKSFSYK